ncbi:MAG: PrsW family intramembrane metalloprotease [Candidatus Promineifilaceae bacterium]|nr:PrsW family intramembrane metalloprotease [Candidatus Promineifilaceae bacterium]
MEPATDTILLLSILAAALPAAVYVGLIYAVDRYEKEPVWLLTATFLWGAIPSILLALLFGLVGSLPLYLLAGPEVGNTLSAVLIAPPVEETVKALALLGIFFLLRREVDGLLDGIIYGAMVGMGFAMIENIFYFLTVYGESGVEAWQTNIFMRAILFGLNHSLFTSMTGLGLAVGRFARSKTVRFLAPVGGWTVAVALHAFHNLAASVGGLLCFILPLTDWGGVWLLMLIIVWALIQEKRWIRSYLKEEVDRGTITVGQYERVASSRARHVHCVSLLFTRGPRTYRQAVTFYRQCSELAYKKHHFALLQEPQSAELTEKLRLKLRELSQQVG